MTCSPTTEGCQPATDKLVEKIVKHDSWPIQPDIRSPPLLRLTSRKPLWVDLQPVDIKSRWRHNWKSAQVVNSHLVCNPTIWQWSVSLWRDPDDVSHCQILSPDKTEWRLIWATLQMKTLFRGWPVMAHERHTRRRSHIHTLQQGNLGVIVSVRLTRYAAWLSWYGVD